MPRARFARLMLLFLGPALIVYSAFSIYPLVVSLVRSFQDYNQTKATWRWIGLRNYEDLFTSSEFWTVVKNTLILMTAGVAAAQVAEHTSFEVHGLDTAETTRLPTGEEQKLIQEVIDPKSLRDKEVRA